MTYGIRPWGSAPRKPRTPDTRVADAYRRAGWLISDTGKAIPPIPPSGPRPPGLYKPPEPRRDYTPHHAAQPLPRVANSYVEIPERVRALYEVNPETGRYVRTPAGDALADYRAARAAEPHLTPTIKRRSMTRVQWGRLVAVAEAVPERRDFVAAKAAGRIKVEG
jgi:hypothetical protein